MNSFKQDHKIASLSSWQPRDRYNDETYQRNVDRNNLGAPLSTRIPDRGSVRATADPDNYEDMQFIGSTCGFRLFDLCKPLETVVLTGPRWSKPRGLWLRGIKRH